ncbi:hypothetical protein CY34DRAFT_774182, partial [Suillus luteus UH-Slu-Lm8-n1]
MAWFTFILLDRIPQVQCLLLPIHTSTPPPSSQGHNTLNQTFLLKMSSWQLLHPVQIPTKILLTAANLFTLTATSQRSILPVELASLLDPKNLDALEAFGGIDTLLDGLGTDSLGGLTPAGTAGAGVGGSQSGRLTCAWLVPRFWDTSASLLASPLDWVEGVAIMIAVLIVVVVGSINDWQKERQFKVLNEKKEECEVKVIRDGIERLIDVKEVIVGNVALLEPREIDHCDGIFLAGHNVKHDESVATCKSDAIKKASYADCLMLKQALSGVHAEGGV